jgi:hypothetical protein
VQGQGAILVYRVRDYAATVARLRARNLAVHELEIPHGPCATSAMEAGQTAVPAHEGRMRCRVVSRLAGMHKYAG